MLNETAVRRVSIEEVVAVLVESGVVQKTPTLTPLDVEVEDGAGGPHQPAELLRGQAGHVAPVHLGQEVVPRKPSLR